MCFAPIAADVKRNEPVPGFLHRNRRIAAVVKFHEKFLPDLYL
jgi:hypothetical protein